MGAGSRWPAFRDQSYTCTLLPGRSLALQQAGGGNLGHVLENCIGGGEVRDWVHLYIEAVSYLCTRRDRRVEGNLEDVLEYLKGRGVVH